MTAALLQPLRILVVDDEPRVLEMLARVLRREHEVVTVTCGDAAIEQSRPRSRGSAHSPVDDPSTAAAKAQKTTCADADLASIDSLLDDAADVLCELAAAAATARERWPAMSETDELRAVLEAVRNIATESRTKLATARDRAARFRDEHHHLHVRAVALCGWRR